MPIGFSDLLKTTAQLDNNLTKGIVNTDETYGGIRSKIDDWTDLHLSTFNSGSGYTYQDDGTAAAPGHFKAYSTMFYVADGRSLVEDSTASSDFIRLDASGNYVESGGTKYVVDSGDASPGYYVLKDATQVGGTGTGTNKLPKFSITGAQGSDTSTALPAGYESFTSANNSSPAITVTDTNADTNYNLVFATAGTDQQLFVDATTSILQYNPANSTLTIGTSIQSVSLSTGTLGATGDIVSDLIPGNAAGGYAERDLGSSSLPWHELYVKDAIYFEGTANAHETKIIAVDPTGDNVITLPNATGILAFENADTSGTAGALATAGTITFTGDVTGGTTPTYTSGGDLSIAMTIQPDSVGLGDLQDIADERLLGRVNDSDGSVAQLTKADVLGMLNVADGANAYAHPNHSGDVTSTGDGATVIAPNVVTIAKMQQIATNSFLGRDTDSDGNVEVLSATAARGILNVADGANNYGHPTQSAITVDSDTTLLSGATVISDVDIDISVNTLGHVTAASYTTATRDLTLSDLGYTGDTDAEANVATNLAIGTSNGTTQQITSSTGNNVNLVVASATEAGIVTNGAQTFAGNKLFDDNVTVGGNLTVAGDVIQQNSTTVVFNDTFLDLNVANTASTYATDSGFRFARKTSAANVLSENAALTYDADVDQFKFTRHTDSVTGAVGSADNVAALKFNKTDTNVGQADQADGTTTMDATEEANASSVRSLGAVSKCSITITTDAANVGDNYAPAEAGAVGYPIKHNLGTQSVFVVAIQTVNNSGSTMNDPQPVYCKYIPEDDNTVRVSVGVTQATEEYDIIVIG